MEGLTATEGEELSRELRAVQRRVLSLLQELAQLGIVQAGGEHLQIGGDYGQEIVEIMRDPAGELPDRLHLLRLPEFVFDLLATGEVADESGEDSLSVDPRLPDMQFHRENGS